jgi:hypothetical protein
MRIKKILSRDRRDFTAIFECESCSTEEERRGYDDAYFHKQVIPDIACSSCGEKSPRDNVPMTPKYNEDQIV